jgi:membrane-associated phospholipid phosphatase
MRCGRPAGTERRSEDYPEAFSVPLSGGFLTRLNATIVAQGSSVYDVFPSLHVLVTCVLLNHDWRYVRRRFQVMVLPALGLLFSTIYLRYHYAVDLAAGFALFAALRWGNSREDRE